MCNRYTQRFKIVHKSHRYDAMSKSEGVIHATKSENLKALYNHQITQQHRGIVKKLQDMTIGELYEDDYDYNAGDYENGIFQTTINMLKLGHCLVLVLTSSRF